MSLWAEYKKERNECEMLEKENGFITYIFLQDGECYLEDVYVRPEFRKTGLAQELTNEVATIAKEKGFKTLVGSVRVGSKADTESLRLLIAYGFKLATLNGNMIYMAKEL